MFSMMMCLMPMKMFMADGPTIANPDVPLKIIPTKINSTNNVTLNDQGVPTTTPKVHRDYNLYYKNGPSYKFCRYAVTT